MTLEIVLTPQKDESLQMVKVDYSVGAKLPGRQGSSTTGMVRVDEATGEEQLLINVMYPEDDPRQTNIHDLEASRKKGA